MRYDYYIHWVQYCGSILVSIVVYNCIQSGSVPCIDRVDLLTQIVIWMSSSNKAQSLDWCVCIYFKYLLEIKCDSKHYCEEIVSEATCKQNVARMIQNDPTS